MSAGPSAVEILTALGYDDTELEALLGAVTAVAPQVGKALREEIFVALVAAQAVGSVQGAYNPHTVKERWGDLKLINDLGLSNWKAYAPLPDNVTVTVVAVGL